jgi:hypothetical protein
VTREEHLNWCKQRAREYLAIGDLNNAFASMISDLRKHPETETHAGAVMGIMLHMNGHLSTLDKMSRFIEGFN